MLFFGDADQSFAFLLTGTAKLNVSCLNAVMQTKKAVFMTYIESLAVSPICLFLLPAVLGYQRNLAGAPGNGRHYDRDLRLIRKDRKMKNKVKFRQLGSVTLFVLPALIPLIVFWIYPILRSVYISFTDWDYMTPDYNFVFFDNFISLFQDARFYDALGTQLCLHWER